jgi:Flp pilus assembly protein protease CpaA
MQFLIAITLCWIAWSDLRTHRIPNRALILLLLSSLLTHRASVDIVFDQFLVAATAFCIGLLLWRFFGLGMGDVKLISIMALLLIPATLDSYLFFATIFSIVSSIHLLAQALALRSFSQPLPLAPSIVLAYIWLLYLK